MAGRANALCLFLSRGDDLQQHIYRVSEVNQHIKQLIDADPGLNALLVRGEISNYKVYPSGHHYFTLKDGESALRCVMFAGMAKYLRFRPQNGMKVVASGKISVYPRDGGYQLYCSRLVSDGLGDLHIAFEQLKERLYAQGLFDSEHKKPLPAYPRRIGVVTSPAGAAVHDMIRILRRRFPLAKVLLLPVRVQGEEAAGEIADAIAYANRYHLADVLIVGRGGGSVEDLWAFNEEVVSRAIFDSRIPVVSAVGHEPDVTISDYVADLRAATPSNAAELAVPDQDALRQNLDAMSSAMASALSRQLKAARQHLNVLSQSPALRSPTGYIEQREKSLELLKNRLIAAQNQSITRKNQRYIAAVSKLDAMSPLKVLTRGYSMAQTEAGEVLRSVRQVELGERVSVLLSDGKLSATVMDKKEEAR